MVDKQDRLMDEINAALSTGKKEESDEDSDSYVIDGIDYKALASQRTQEDRDNDMEEFLAHPLNCKEITPEILQRPEYQALQEMAFDGTSEEVAKNFSDHGMSSLEKVLLKMAAVDSKEVEEALYCFDTGLEQKCGNAKIEFKLLLGRAKANMLVANFGKVKEDCIQALKRKSNSEQAWFILCRSRFFVEKYDDCQKFLKFALVKCPTSGKIHDLKKRCDVEMEKVQERVMEITTLQNVAMDKKLELYSNMRSKKIKVGKKVHHLPEIVDVSINIDKKGKLHFPVLILYDEYMQTDFIQDFCEDDTFRDHLTEVFRERPPWDEENIYNMGTIEVYFECDSTKPLDPKDVKSKSTKKYVRCKLDDTLLESLKHANHVIPQYPVFKVLSKKNDDFKDSFLNEI